MAGLEASTVTPGSTAPDGSRTVPVKVPCANTVDANAGSMASAITHFNSPRMAVLLASVPARRVWVNGPDEAAIVQGGSAPGHPDDQGKGDLKVVSGGPLQPDRAWKYQPEGRRTSGCHLRPLGFGGQGSRTL